MTLDDVSYTWQPRVLYTFYRPKSSFSFSPVLKEIFVDFFTFQYMSLSPQVKRNQIINIRNCILKMSSGTNFDCCASKLQKINVKHSREKPLIDFVNLYAIFSSRLSAKFKREVFYELHLPIPLVKVSLLIIIFSENSSLILTCFFNYTLARKEIAKF